MPNKKLAVTDLFKWEYFRRLRFMGTIMLFLCLGVSYLYFAFANSIFDARRANEVILKNLVPLEQAIDGDYVYLTGRVSSREPITEPLTGYQFDAVSVVREEYRWKQISYDCGVDGDSTCWRWDWEYYDSGQLNVPVLAIDGTTISGDFIPADAFALASLPGYPPKPVKTLTQHDRIIVVKNNALYSLKESESEPAENDIKIQFLNAALGKLSVLGILENGVIMPHSGSSLSKAGTFSAKYLLDEDNSGYMGSLIGIGFFAFFLMMIFSAILWSGAIKGGSLAGREALLPVEFSAYLLLIAILLAWVF